MDELGKVIRIDENTIFNTEPSLYNTFDSKEKRMANKAEVYQLKIFLDESEPLIWRRVHVPTGMTLRALHRLIQALFEWRTYHLYEFKVGDTKYGDPELDPYDELDWRNDQTKKLDNIFKSHNKFEYLYDFGDGWQHIIKLEATLEAEKDEKYPLCIGGQNPAPPEDCGGIGGYYNKLEISSDPSHSEHEDIVNWFEYMMLKDNFDLAEINELRISRRKVLVK